MKKKKLIPCIIAIVAIVLLGIAGVKLYQLMFGGAVKVQTADIISAIAQMKLQLIIGAVILIAGIVILIIGLRKKDEKKKFKRFIKSTGYRSYGISCRDHCKHCLFWTTVLQSQYCLKRDYRNFRGTH